MFERRVLKSIWLDLKITPKAFFITHLTPIPLSLSIHFPNVNNKSITKIYFTFGFEVGKIYLALNTFSRTRANARQRALPSIDGWLCFRLKGNWNLYRNRSHRFSKSSNFEMKTAKSRFSTRTFQLLRWRV